MQPTGAIGSRIKIETIKEELDSGSDTDSSKSQFIMPDSDTSSDTQKMGGEREKNYLNSNGSSSSSSYSSDSEIFDYRI